MIMAASSGSLDTSANSHPTLPTAKPYFSFSNSLMSPTTSFTDLLASDVYPPTTTTAAGSRGLADRIAERTGSGVPKLKSIPPPSLPISSPSISPSSYFAIPAGLSPAELLDSPFLLSSSNILPSPTTGTFPFQAFNWKTNISDKKQGTMKQEEKNYSDFSFQPQTKHPPSANFTTVFQSQTNTEQKPCNYQESSTKLDNLSSGNYGVIYELSSMQRLSPEISPIQTNDSQSNSGFQTNYNQTSQQSMNEQRRSGDGYNWRKYGQKQVKTSENPRSYYKCTYLNCPTKKKVERSLDGQITEIVYKGNHSQPKPRSTKRSSSSAAAPQAVQLDSYLNEEIHEQSYASQGTGQMDSVLTPENSSISIGDDDFNQSSQKSNNRSGIEEYDEDEPDAKRWKSINEIEGLSAPGSRTVREPRVVVQTISDIDILDDGYRWRKYGQKVVKGNPNPRSYYKCTHPGCPVRKHVERAANDKRSVITTYEGKHNHHVPAARGSASHSINGPLQENTSNDAAAVANRPFLMPHNNISMINQICGLRQQTSETQSPFTLEMLQGNSVGPYMNESQLANNVFSKTKEEPQENLFLESLLC